MDVVNDERLDTLPNLDELLESGLTYLQWRVYEQITPLSHSEMLNAEMTIRIDENHGIYKLGIPWAFLSIAPQSHCTLYMVSRLSCSPMRLAPLWTLIFASWILLTRLRG